MVRVGDWKLIHFYDPKKPDELYNIKRDISEQNNLIQKEPERAIALKKKMQELLNQTHAVLPTVK